MSEIVKVLEVPVELITEAIEVFNTEKAMLNLLEHMVAVSAKNRVRQNKLWSKVFDECRKSGIDPEKDGVLTFHHMTDKFVIVKADKA